MNKIILNAHNAIRINMHMWKLTNDRKYLLFSINISKDLK